MSYGMPTDTITTRWEAACFNYLCAVFHREPDQVIMAAAREVYRYSPVFVLKSESVH